MSSMPLLVLNAIREFVESYQPGRMLSNFGDSHIPSPESVDSIKKWLIQNE